MAGKKIQATAYAVWPTAWGPMGAAAGARGVCRVILPHYPTDHLRELLAWEFPGAVQDEAPFEELIALSRDYFNAKVADFSQVPCDLPPEGSFAGSVLRACRAIPYGQTRSYHVLAETVGRNDAARAVAAALGKNPTPLLVPCHRVTYADGRIGGFSAAGGEALKRRVLELERSVAAREKAPARP
ncbi:MAG: methylated-DNA--[protein]-cysteine S-methyltransferase [Phycisphaerae bacterium]|nr:methylated-DNA--[protein]-cysteine S-methyltransferase [Phycisphaerae bacterium]